MKNNDLPGVRWRPSGSRAGCLAILLVAGVGLVGCRSPQQHREKADEVAAEIVEQKQTEALGKTEPFSIERPSDLLRRRLLEEQGLLFADEASFGTDRLERIEHWPEDDYRPFAGSPDGAIVIEPNKPLKLSLNEALQVGARNSFDYQSRKEGVFQAALDLDLARNVFRNIFGAEAASQLTTDTTGYSTVTAVGSGAVGRVTRSLKNGLDLSGELAINLAYLLTQGGASALGLTGDFGASMPLLRGSGRHIVTEPLTQAERNVLYEMWDFERFKRTFAVDIADQYFAVLSQMDSVQNSEDNYESAVVSARWSRRRGDAGRMDELEVDEAVQRELNSRANWISSQERLKNRLDAFKTSIGLPADALIDLDRGDLELLQGRAKTLLESSSSLPDRQAAETAPPADAPVELVPASYEDAGPLEMDPNEAVRLALDNRLDMQVAIGGVYDAQRRVVVRADALRAGLDLGGEVSLAEDDGDGSLRLDGASYKALLTLDLPIERTAERNAYRNSLISLERATRSVQTLEDQIKLSIRRQLRTLLESREGLKIQAQSVVLAEKRVRSSTLFVEAGRNEIRFLLEAQDALLDAQNQLTAALVDYRIAELAIQRDMGVLEVNEKGLWQEFSPEEIDHDS